MISGLLVSHVMLNLDQEDRERFPSLLEAQPGTRKKKRTMCSIRREGESSHWGLSRIDQALGAGGEEGIVAEEEIVAVAEEGIVAEAEEGIVAVAEEGIVAEAEEAVGESVAFTCDSSINLSFSIISLGPSDYDDFDSQCKFMRQAGCIFELLRVCVFCSFLAF